MLLDRQPELRSPRKNSADPDVASLFQNELPIIYSPEESEPRYASEYTISRIAYDMLARGYDRKHVLKFWMQYESIKKQLEQTSPRRDGTPQYNHPKQVVLTLFHEFGVDDYILMLAALFHDALEDIFPVKENPFVGENPDRFYTTRIELIQTSIGVPAGRIVGALTKLPTGNRQLSEREKEEFETEYFHQVVNGASHYPLSVSERSKSIRIKIADRIVNLRTQEHDIKPKFDTNENDHRKGQYVLESAKYVMGLADFIQDTRYRDILQTVIRAEATRYKVLDQLATIEPISYK